ncbi:MAG: methyltransferase RsmF C-terminal domain-like protein [Candidatus Micrarchaeia archaeon]
MHAQKFRNYLRDRFGIILPGGVELVGEKSLRAMNSELKNFRVSTPKGIPASRMKGKFPKPTTSFIQIFGNLAKKNIVEVSREEALKFMAGRDLEKNPSCERGYVILTHRKAVLGIGFFREGKIENMIPKGRRITPG